MSFFDDVRFVIQPDRKGNSDLITSIGYADLCSEGFMEAIEPEKWGYMEENGLMTDILTLKEKDWKFPVSTSHVVITMPIPMRR